MLDVDLVLGPGEERSCKSNSIFLVLSILSDDNLLSRYVHCEPSRQPPNVPRETRSRKSQKRHSAPTSPPSRPSASSLITTPSRLPPGKLDNSPFTQLPELWRWVERLLWRAICLSSLTCNIHASQDNDNEEGCLWMWSDKYTVVSASWPPTFRTDRSYRQSESTPK
jgi:hypothetical protein